VFGLLIDRGNDCPWPYPPTASRLQKIEYRNVVEEDGVALETILTHTSLEDYCQPDLGVG
jgi:hypothetical protein